jgi:hypothetical protein
LSTIEEIQEVYQSDIDQKTNIVRQRQGIEAFLPRNMVKGADGFSVYNYPNPDEIACSDRSKRFRSKKVRQTK